MQRPDVINHLQQEIMHGGKSAFDLIPKLLKAVIEDGHWRNRAKRDGTPFTSFREFVEEPLAYGLETTEEKLLAMCRYDEEAKRLFLSEIAPASAQGGNRLSVPEQADIVRFKSDHGNSAIHAIARLKRDAPELADKVVKGELSINAAAIQAGFRRPKFQVVVDDLEMAAKIIARHFGPRLPDLIAALQQKLPRDA